MKYLKVLLLLCVPNLFFAQGPIFQKIQKATIKAKAPSPNFNLVNVTSNNLEDRGVKKSELTKGLLVDLDFASINALRNQKPELVKMEFPLPDLGNVQMTLMPNKIFTPDFILQKSSAPGVAANYRPGAYYFGVLDHDPNSIVAISVFENEIIGMINTANGNYVIGKLKNQNTTTHLIYNDLELKAPLGLDCGTVDDGLKYEPSQLFNSPEDVGDCIRVYIEIDDDIVSNKGGVTGATNYVTGLFNESITLYANESLAMAISEIKAWDTPAPYSGGSSSAMLSSYQSNTGAFNGDLSHLVSYQASGGIAAGFSGICNSNVDNSKCFSSINTTYSNVPTYSFSVMVVTHEMGHLIGSRHTHACVWNGNNTAIDGCAGGTEGGCSVPGSPSGGGTIMSYCHITTGIDFTQGFGPQPGNVIRNTVASATCLSTCGGGPTPTCTDGIQNGNETGVDCGGPDCPPCNSNCDDNEVVINITFDNYPEETSWQVTNSGGSVVASGGTYPNSPDGSSFSETLCLVDGCYDFTINDSYGDGICCAYGSGSYAVTSDGSTLASGGAFTSSETTNFCVGTPVGPTCTDGIQNGDETGVDCGGSVCDPCPTSGVLLASYFETGWDGWSDGGSDCYRYSGTRSYEGSYSIRLRDNSGTASAMTSGAFNVSSYSSIEVKFYFYPNSMENGEDFWVRYYDGSSWNTVAAYASGTSFTNNNFYVATVTINSSSYNFPSNAQFRFQCDASANADRVYIDQVTITGIAGGLIEGETIVTIEELDQIEPSIGFNLEAAKPLRGTNIFPNPANELLNLSTDGDIQSVRIIAHTGKVIRIIESTDQRQQLNISDLTPGIYYLMIQVDGEMIPKKFIKM